jgi:hypothetical protein
MARAHFTCPDGLTIGELKAILADCPDTDTDGEDAVVFMLVGNGHLSPLTEVIVDDENSTILLPEFHAETMVELGTYDEFFGFEPEILDDEEGEGCELESVGLN